MINRYHTSLYCKIFTVSLQTIISNLKWSEGVATTNCTSIPQLDSWCICVCFRCYIYKCVFFFRVGMAWWIQFSFFFFCEGNPTKQAFWSWWNTSLTETSGFDTYLPCCGVGTASTRKLRLYPHPMCDLKNAESTKWCSRWRVFSVLHGLVRWENAGLSRCVFWLHCFGLCQRLYCWYVLLRQLIYVHIS